MKGLPLNSNKSVVTFCHGRSDSEEDNKDSAGGVR